MPKHICFLDDSAEYDGFSPTSRPLDGPQKAVAYLAASLAQRGHQVTVITRAETVLACDGVHSEWADRTTVVHLECDHAGRKLDSGMAGWAGDCSKVRRAIWHFVRSDDIQRECG